MGPFTTTDRDNSYLLVIGDYFTKYAVAVPLPDMTAETVAQAFIDSWVCYFGVPLELHMDQGTNFDSALFKGMCNLLGIVKTRTTQYRAQSDGFVERLNKTICNILNCIIYENPFQWDQLIRSCTLAYNSSVQESIGETPAAMCYGSELTLPIDLCAPNFENRSKDIKNPTKFVLDLQDSLHKIHHYARDHLEKSQIKQRKYYNNRLKIQTYEVGDTVYYYHPINLGGKEASYKWKGPFYVTKRFSDHVYKIQQNLHSKPMIVNHDKLKIAYIRGTPDNKWVFELNNKTGKEVKPTENVEVDTQNVRPRRQTKMPAKFKDSILL
jgi:hypothetical protein